MSMSMNKRMAGLTADRRLKKGLACLMTVLLLAGCGPAKPKASEGEAAPPPSASPDETFAYALKGVLTDAYTESQRVGALQFDLLFDPAAKPDPSKSSSTHMAVNLMNPDEPDETASVVTDALVDASKGDASFVLSVGSGQEQANTGGVYFVGDQMTIKRGDAEKKMVQYALSPEQKAAYVELTALERLTRTLEGDPSGTKAKDQWQADIDGYLTTLKGIAAATDYKEEKLTVTVLEQQQEAEAVVLTLGGDKGWQALKGLIGLLKQNAAMNGIYDGIGSEDDNDTLDGLDRVQAHVDALTPEQVSALQFSLTAAVHQEKPLTFTLKASAGDQSLELTQMFYSDGYERHQQVTLKHLDGSAVAYTDKNKSTGGDNYAGETSMAVTKAGGIEGDLSKVQWTSVNTKDVYSADYTYAYTFYDTDEGVRTATNTSGKLKWEQKKAGGQDITGSGKGEFHVDSDGETQVILLDMTMEQKYGAVTVTAPEFLPAAGVTANSRETLFQALEKDQADYDEEALFGRIMSGLALLAY